MASNSDSFSIQKISAWANLLKIGFAMTLAGGLYWLNTTYVKKVDFTPVAQSIEVQAAQVAGTALEVKSISRRLARIVDDEGRPINTDLMVEMREDIAKILARQEFMERHLSKQAGNGADSIKSED